MAMARPFVLRVCGMHHGTVRTGHCVVAQNPHPRGMGGGWIGQRPKTSLCARNRVSNFGAVSQISFFVPKKMFLMWGVGWLAEVGQGPKRPPPPAAAAVAVAA